MRASRLIPAVEYLQAQRARSMMMMKLAEATADVDVYLAPAGAAVAADVERADADAARRQPRTEQRQRRVAADAARRRGGERSAPQPDAAAFQYGEPGVLSGARHTQWVLRERVAVDGDVLWRGRSARRN